jgi:hypothetical protein
MELVMELEVHHHHSINQYFSTTELVMELEVHHHHSINQCFSTGGMCLMCGT